LKVTEPPANAAKLVGTRQVFATVLDVALPSSRGAASANGGGSGSTEEARPQHSPHQGAFFAPRAEGGDDAVSFWNEGQRMQVE